MFEKEAEDSFNSKKVLYKWETDKHSYMDGFKGGAEFGYNKALEEWKKCFLSCSSPFCSKHFPTVESSGVLGNMEKEEK